MILSLPIFENGPASASIPCASGRSVSASRATPETLCRQAETIGSLPLLRQVLDAMPHMVVILNRNRQIVSANQAFLDTLMVTAGELTDKRPGEAIGCIRAKEGPDGCGSSLYCTACGAMKAIEESAQNQQVVTRECRMLTETLDGPTSFNLRATARLLHVAEEKFTFVVLDDISDEKRLAELQRTFFHDVLNTAGCIQGYLEFLASKTMTDTTVFDRLTCLSTRLVQEIRAQQELMQAESHDLKVQPVPLKAADILAELRTQYLQHDAAVNRDIEVQPTTVGSITTDRLILLRVLGNMLKNALEASATVGKITLACTFSDDSVRFSVSNPEVMPPDVQLQVFQRSFSTKGQAGRGIGTYSMKLLGERYLKGRVDFQSVAPEGTTFRLTLPQHLPSS